jgi:hypothetical protein
MTDNIQEEIEDKIIDLIASGASGRLIVFKPENSDKDLIVEKRGNYKKKVISLNVYGREFFGDQNIAKEIYQLAGKKNLNAEENFYLVFVRFDIVKQDIDDSFWIIPSLDLQKIEGGKGDFSKFLTNKKDFIRFLIEAL